MLTKMTKWFTYLLDLLLALFSPPRASFRDQCNWSDFLPHDVLIDILTRLPIRTLLQCTCVCKSWYSLVTNPSFITTHLTRPSLANHHRHFLLVRSHSRKGANYSILRCENEKFSDYAELALPPNRTIDRYSRIIGCCNGLICLLNQHSYKDEIYLWNPSIQKSMALPPTRVKFQSHGVIGFGFDPLTDDYKIVRIVYLDGLTGSRTFPEVDIFSLSTGTWRDISHLDLPHNICTGTRHAYVNGAAHWLACNRTMRSTFFYLIVSFHMGDEVFGEIMVPATIFRRNSWGNVCVARFQESLSLVVALWGEATCCIWVMKEYGVSESWTKQFNIDTSTVGVVKSVAGFTRKGQVLFRTKLGSLVAYDPEAERVMPLPPSLDGLSRDSFYVDAYAESLVLLGAKFCDTTTCQEIQETKDE